MAIEKMTFADIKGNEDLLDEVLLRIARCGMFHLESSVKLSEYSIGTAALIRNPYGALKVKLGEIASLLSIQIDMDYQLDPFDLPKDRTAYIDHANELLDSIDDAAMEKSKAAAILSKMRRQVEILHSAYELRRYPVVIRGEFRIIGHLLTSDKEAFAALFQDIAPAITVALSPADINESLPIPIKLRNNWFVRPFEMFVRMYGLPSYNDIDPTPFVAYTYSLLFGLMFGDIGQGLCVLLLGAALWKFKRIELGAIMSRIGVSSMFFGFCFGSVFGFEHLLDPVFRQMGFAEKPIEVMLPSTTNLVLIGAIGIGAFIILTVILFNIRVGIKNRDFERIALSHNGIAGFVFYASALLAAVSTLMGKSVVTPLYITCLIVLPVVVMFFKEPITAFVHYHSNRQFIQSDRKLKRSKKFHEGAINIPELFASSYVASRFGRIPTDNYKKLTFYQNEPFVLYPLKTDQDYIWCIYVTAYVHKEEIDAIFHSLYFERVFIPQEEIATPQLAEAFIKKCIDSSSTPDDAGAMIKNQAANTLYKAMFPSGVGGFLTQTIFEMFEIILSFITNTMSFLRVGGFILVHAGMMEVVFQLSHMVGSGASPFVIIIGNIFVMAMEGLIVGIQTLRLEFYEIFSRFFDAKGEQFVPVRI